MSGKSDEKDTDAISAMSIESPLLPIEMKKKKNVSTQWDMIIMLAVLLSLLIGAGITIWFLYFTNIHSGY